MKPDKFLREYWFVVVAIAALVVFFYPKECGSVAYSPGYTYQDCTCIGIKIGSWQGSWSGAVPAGGGRMNCWGIVTSRNCYENRFEEGKNFTSRYYKSCEGTEVLCTQDSDCVPEQCCHPTSCINKNFKPVCEEFCSMVCAPGTMDCGAGHCACMDNTCHVVVKFTVS